MMEYWWLYLLVFMFGYMTHKTFYFFRSVKISIGLIRVSQLVSLGVLAKSMENFYYARTVRLRGMLDLHPKFYEPIIDFENWNTAMKYLEENKHFVQQLLTQDNND